LCTAQGGLDVGAFSESIHSIAQAGLSKQQEAEAKANAATQGRRALAAAPLLPRTESLYVVGYHRTSCMFSARAVCMSVTVDLLDATGATAELLLDAERGGELEGYPWRIQFATKESTLNISDKIKIIVWNVIGFLLFLFCCRVAWKTFHAYKNRHAIRQSALQRQHTMERHTVFS
jgi:hypothetical protein